MDADLQAVADALVELADAELHAIEDAANEFILYAAGFLSWLEHLADWEMDRRDGLESPLRPPHAVIPRDEHAVSVEVAGMLRERFAEDVNERAAIVGLFDAIVGALAVGHARQQ
jgi:hypothetical protein